MERALKGTRTPIVSQGEILGWWDKPDNVLLRFLLQHRLPDKYGLQNLKPGHPVYDGIAREAVAAWERAQEQDEAEVLASLDAFIEDMRQRRLANEALLAEVPSGGEESD